MTDARLAVSRLVHRGTPRFLRKRHPRRMGTGDVRYIFKLLSGACLIDGLDLG